MDCSLTGSSSMGFSRQEYWSGLPFPSAGDLPDIGIDPGVILLLVLFVCLLKEKKIMCVYHRV